MSNSILEQIRQVGTARGRARFGRFSIEGTRLVERAVRAGWTVTAAIHTPSFAEKVRHQLLLNRLDDVGCRVTAVPAEHLNEFTGGRDLGGIIALVEQKKQTADLLASAKLVCVVVDVIEPGNVGALIRSAHGLGAEAFVTVGKSDPYNPKAVRTSMGSLFKLPVIQFETFEAFVTAAHRHDLCVIGSYSHSEILLPDLTWVGRRVAIVLGNEFYGLSAEHQAQCDQLVTIPMADGIDSFSVSAAGAILLYALQHIVSSSDER